MLRYSPPEYEIDGRNIILSEYFVEDTGEFCYIHRILTVDEIEQLPEKEVAITMDGTFITPKIAKCNDVKEAETAIQSYWAAVKQLNSM